MLKDHKHYMQMARDATVEMPVFGVASLLTCVLH